MSPPTTYSTKLALLDAAYMLEALGPDLCELRPERRLLPRSERPALLLLRSDYLDELCKIGSAI